MKNKKLFICMLTMLATVTYAGFASCKEDAPAVSVDIQQESETLNVLDETTLSVLTENATSDVTWSSSDEKVATVENGVVVAWNAGTATITATVNGVSDSCVVQVLRSTEAPILNVSRTQISVDKGGEYTVTASVQWLGEDVTDKVKLNWELGAGAQEDVATVTPKESGTAVIKGVAVGETDYYVSATIGDAYVNQKLSITVCDSSVWFDSEDLEIGDNGKFLLSMNTIDEEGNPGAVEVPDILAYRGEEQIPNVNYIWSTTDESIVKIEDGKLVAQRAGMVDVYGTYEGNRVVVTVSIERAVIYLDETPTFELADLKSVELNTQIVGSGVVLLNEVEIGTLENGAIMLDASKYPTTSKKLGKNEIVVNTDRATYVLTANLYSMFIETAEELDAWHAYAFANGDDGYYALGNNINYNGAYTGSRNWDKTGYSWANPDTAGFKGIFDGNGYIIDGLRIESGFRGFVTLLQSDGVIKNVAFTNASYSAIGAYVCQWGCGTIENVYVQFAKNAPTGYSDNNTSLGGVFMAADNARNMVGTMTIKNCFVDASKTVLSHFRHSYIGGFMQKDRATGTWNYGGAYAKLNDVYVVGPNTLSDGSEAKLCYNDLVAGSANYALYTSASEMAADSETKEVIAKWDNSFWGVNNGMPTPLRIIERGYSLDVDLPASSNYYTFNGDSFAYPGKDYTFTLTPTVAGLDDFTVLVNGEKVESNQSGVYTVTNVQGALDIDVVHAYIEVSGNNNPTATYDKTTDTWTLSKAVLASYEGVREHGNAYISKEYIEYMISQGYTKLKFTIQPDGIYAVQACYKYNGVVYLATKTGEAVEVTVDLTAVSELEFWGQNSSGSGSAIKNTDCYVTVSDLTLVK